MTRYGTTKDHKIRTPLSTPPVEAPIKSSELSASMLSLTQCSTQPAATTQTAVVVGAPNSSHPTSPANVETLVLALQVR